ncbi:primosomal protein N' [Moraxella nasibovis]|uniref:primosomal protein N' n=1 Tax=Moraxella nasibovis TaxID=2904120 RepID=UPI00240FC5A5|nr:primosomal protein N' [Moraxella nasibovis]WFF38119.1 primosomal protein N' [Moraxella nasibovis]
MPTTLLRIALPTPLYRSFDYLCPSDCLVDHQLPQVGCRVRVPFGRQELVGIIIAHIASSDSDVPFDKLKPIYECLDDTAIISDELLHLANWLSAYYHYPLGETLSVMLPSPINQGKPTAKTCTFWQLIDGIDDITAQQKLPKNAKKQWQTFHALKDNPPSLSDAQIKELGINKAQLTALQDKGLIHARTDDGQLKNPKKPTLQSTPLTLNDEQQTVFLGIKTAMDERQYRGILLNGITGSGKTEVYLHAMWHALALGKQVLVLVPEIGLTPQTKARFSSRFNANICVLHSGMNDGERLQGWQDCRSGFAQIIIGTRSSVLYPFDNLGLIIIDESHDSSYKQQDHLRYHACDVALWRGYQAGIPVLLGTATPSLEQLKLAQDGKLSEYKLIKRAGNAKSATMQLIDIKQGTRSVIQANGQEQNTLLCKSSIWHIKNRLANGEQVLIFLNRRGYAPILMCDGCGWQADCPNCDAHLTLHKYPTNQLKCHHCGFCTHTPSTCPECNSQNLLDLGLGTSKLGEQLHAIFGNPQTTPQTYPIWQIDKDTMRKKGAWEAMYDRILTGEPAILVGTQMIAKGHHFPNVTLVVVVDADLGFLSPDFRSPEHTAQRIIQVAGRAGRADKTGDVLIQTRQPDNPLLITLIKHGYLAFAQILLKERQLLGLPPFTHAALIRAESPHQERTRTAISDITKRLPNLPNLAKSGMIDAPMNKKNNRYHSQLLLLAKDRKTLHTVLSEHWQDMLALPSTKGIKLSLDIDPMGW